MGLYFSWTWACNILFESSFVFQVFGIPFLPHNSFPQFGEEAFQAEGFLRHLFDLHLLLINNHVLNVNLFSF